DFRQDFLENLARLGETAKSEREQADMSKLAEALDAYWKIYNQSKKHLNSQVDDLPPDLILAINHLNSQVDIMLDTVQVVMRARVAAAAEVGRQAEQVSQIAGVLSLLLGVIVGTVIVRSINDPLRRLVQGTRAIAKGQFWHRLPAQGKDEFAELARDFNVM